MRAFARGTVEPGLPEPDAGRPRGRERSARLRSGRLRLAVCAAAWCAPASMLLPRPNPLTGALILALLMVLPGLAFTLRRPPHLPPGSTFAEALLRAAALAVAYSFGAAVLLSVPLLLMRVLSATAVLCLLALVTTAAAVAPARMGRPLTRQSGRSDP